MSRLLHILALFRKWSFLTLLLDSSIAASAHAQSPSITEQPVNEVVTEGWTATFHVTATGATPLQYQWQMNGTNIFGATKTSYTTLATTQAENGAGFAVSVTNASGTVISNQVSLTIQAPPAPTPTPSPPATLPPINHVFIVVEENHSYSEIIGSGAMPYLQSLANQYGLATNYFADTHPSIGNYFMLTTGQIISNDDKYSATVSEDNIVRHLVAHAKTWREYSEALPSTGYYGGNIGGYVQHHNPLSYFSDVKNNPLQQQNLVAFSQLASDMSAGQLPTYALIVPTDAHNGHSGTALAADQWLQTNIAPLINSPQFQQDGLLVIVFDESRGTDIAGGGGHVAWIGVGPWMKQGYVSGASYQHENLLKTVCDLLGIGSFGAPSLATETARNMAEFLIDNPPPPTPSPTPTPSPAITDLKVTVTDGKGTVIAGRNDTYTIAATNLGPSDAIGVIVSDSFAANFTPVTFTATQTGNATGFTATGAGNINDTLTMPAGSSVTYKATGKMSSSSTGTFSNTASITAPTGVTDSNLGNNSATDTDAIKLQTDLRVTVNDGKTAAIAGQKDTYTIVVTNLGPSDVSGATVSDSFPVEFTGVTFTATQTGGASGFSASGSGNISDIVSLPAGSKITYKAKGTISPSAVGTISDTASVSAPGGVTDPNLANNNAIDTDTL